MPPPENRLLAALPPEECARLVARAAAVTFTHKQVAYRAGGPIEFVYFPRAGLMSAVVVMLDGARAEVAAVGANGMLGVAAAFGATRSAEEVFCQVEPCDCLRLPAADFAAAVGQGGALRRVVYGYVRGVLAASARMVACNSLHAVDLRAARWLLTCRDLAGRAEFPLTHEFLAVMLGVRRATVTQVAGRLAAAGLIAYHHGVVKVVDPAGLEGAACECYRAIRDATAAATA